MDIAQLVKYTGLQKAQDGVGTSASLCVAISTERCSDELGTRTGREETVKEMERCRMTSTCPVRTGGGG